MIKKAIKTLNDHADEVTEEMSDEIQEHLGKLGEMTEPEIQEFYKKLIEGIKLDKKSGAGYTKASIKIRAKKSKSVKKSQRLARRKTKK